ncbi:MAG TPA: type II toxin-antitoxin system VapC family toxin [Stellaceae bacterium]
MYILDTNVVSELRRPRPNPAVVGWLSATTAGQIFIAAVSFGELQAGVEMTRRQDPEKAAAIESWIDAVAASYSIIPMDEVTFRRWARLMHRRSDDLIEDAMIAATAMVHNMTVVTRNLRDFEQFAVPTLNPFHRIV